MENFIEMHNKFNFIAGWLALFTSGLSAIFGGDLKWSLFLVFMGITNLYIFYRANIGE